ncbi:condensation domain-containing protein [Kitasatospora sp. NPDC047058]|uniref:condensation domain-containing protein n=1 Tax=Kitasatospora sp. NPDC047058 TaxID=3155620 RepID=UPI0033EDB4BA
MHTSITAAYLTRFRSVAASSDPPAELLPLTGAQRRFLITRRRDPQSRTDVVPLFFAYPRGTVDLPRLHRAAVRLAAHHPVLRGGFSTVRGTPVLRLGAPSVEAARAETGPGSTAADALRRALLDWPADGPALRLLLAAAPDDDEELLAVALDHAACDEQSLGLVTAGLATAYAEDDGAGPAGDDDGLASYREAVELQLSAEAAAANAAAHAHWSARLGGPGGPGDPGAPAGPGASGTVARTTGMLTDRLPAPTGAARSGVFPALLDAVGAAARRLSGPDRVLALGYPWGGRPPGAPPVVGCFLNTLVHPVPPGPAAGLDELSAAWWDDLDHADTPFDEVLHAARSAGASWTGALDGLLTFEDLQRRPPLVLGGTPGRETHLAGRPLAAPLAVSASHGADLLVRLAWDRDRHPDAAAEAAFRALLDTLRRHLHPAAGD